MSQYDPLPLVVVETDGGAYGPQFRVENMLKDDATVYSTAPSRREDVNVVLCCGVWGQSANGPPPAFSLRAITAAAPVRGFTSPLAHAAVFVSWDRPSLESLAAQWRGVACEHDFLALANAHSWQVAPPLPPLATHAASVAQPCHSSPSTSVEGCAAPAAMAEVVGATGLAAGWEWHARRVPENGSGLDEGAWPPSSFAGTVLDMCAPGSSRAANAGHDSHSDLGSESTTPAATTAEPTPVSSTTTSAATSLYEASGLSQQAAEEEVYTGLLSPRSLLAPHMDHNPWHSPRALPRAAAAAVLLGTLGSHEQVIAAAAAAVPGALGMPAPSLQHPARTFPAAAPASHHLHARGSSPSGLITQQLQQLPSQPPVPAAGAVPSPQLSTPCPLQQPLIMAASDLHPHITPVAFIDLEGVTSRTITLDTPKSGRYILVKLLRPRVRYGEGLDVERLVLHGHVGPPTFASGALL